MDIKQYQKEMIEALGVDCDEETVDSLGLNDNKEMVKEEESNSFPVNAMNRPNLIKNNAIVNVDPITGEKRILSPEKEQGVQASITDIVTGKDKDKIKESINEGTKKYLSDLGMSNEDCIKMFEIINRYDKGEKFDIFKEAPYSFKKLIYNISPSLNKTEINMACRFMLDQFITDIKIDKDWIDLQESLKKELDIPSLAEMYDDYQNDLFNDEIQKAASKLEAKGYLKEAESVRGIAKEYENASSLITLNNAIDDDIPESRRLDKKLKAYKKIYMDFNFKYENSKFKIKNVDLLRPIIYRHTKDDITEEDVKKFVILFCNICKNKDSNDPIDHSFMYHTIEKILLLDHMDQSKESYKNMRSKIENVIDKMKEKNNKELENKKKRGK